LDGSSVTAFDAFALGLLFLSGILALTRGFVREALSITAFVVAALATIFTYPTFKIPMRGLITPGWAADAATIAGVFILVYMAVTLVTHHFTERLRGGSDVGTLDRSAGFIFGVVRGMALLGLALILFNQLTPKDRMPGWLVDARMYPAINATARALQRLAPASAPVNERPVTASKEPANKPARPARSGSNDQGYARGERQSLDQLISTSTENAEQEKKDKSRKK
jgi:membrane protein required for colicin V production